MHEHVMNNQEHVMNNQEHVKNTLEQLRTFKHIQGNYHVLILNSYHSNKNKQLGRRLYLHARSIW